MTEGNKMMLTHIAAPLIGAFLGFYLMRSIRERERPTFVALIGDVGGTNIRLSLRRLCLKSRTSVEVK